MAHRITESTHSLSSYDDQLLVPLPETQDGPTCVLHAISYGAQMALREKMFRVFKKSNVVFKVLHFVHLYERETMVKIYYDRSRRIKGAFRVFHDYGVEIEEPGVQTAEPSYMRLPYFKPFPPTIDPVTFKPVAALGFNDVCRMIKEKKVVIGSFATEPGFDYLGRDAIYDFRPLPGSRFDTHCVLFVDYGYANGLPYLKFLNSRGPGFADGGFGRVYFHCVFQTDEEFCFHTLSFDDAQTSCSTDNPPVPSSDLPPPASDSGAPQPLENSKVVGSDPCCNRILNMTEEEQILGVLRFVAELVWEDAEPTVGEAEITKFCYNAQQHVLAGNWLDIASLMLNSADFFSLGIAEEEVEGLLAVTCSLVTKVARETEGMEIAKLICSMLDQQLGYGPYLGLKTLFSLHNLVMNFKDKAFIQTKVLEYAELCKSKGHITKPFQNMDDWYIDSLEQRNLFADVTGILYDEKE